MQAVNQFRELEIEIINEPECIFEPVSIIARDGAEVNILGPMKWNRLISNSDLSPLFGESFDLMDESWYITNCYVCSDKTSIYFRHATRRECEDQ